MVECSYGSETSPIDDLSDLGNTIASDMVSFYVIVLLEYPKME